MASNETSEYIDRVAAALTPADEDKILARAAQKNRRSAARSKGLVGRIGLLLDMMRDKDFRFTWTSRAVILAGLVYFIIPTDVMPDVLPVIGFVDDAAVIGVVFRRLRHEIERYGESLEEL